MSLDLWPRRLYRMCTHCGGQILLTTTAAGKTMPVDAEPSADGNQAVRRDAASRFHSRALKTGEDELPYERRMMPHFPTTTCKARGQSRQPPPARWPGVVDPPASPPPAGVVDLTAYRLARRGRRR